MKDKKKHAANLGVSEDAATRMIRRAYRKQALLRHPDKNQGSEKAKEDFQKLNESYQALLKEAPSGTEPRKAAAPAPEAPTPAPAPRAAAAEPRRQAIPPRQSPWKKHPWVVPALAATAAVLLLLGSLLQTKEAPVSPPPVAIVEEPAPPALPVQPLESPEVPTPPPVAIAPPRPLTERKLASVSLPDKEANYCLEKNSFRIGVDSFGGLMQVDKEGCEINVSQGNGAELETFYINACIPDVSIRRDDRRNSTTSVHSDCAVPDGEFQALIKRMGSIYLAVAANYDHPRPEEGDNRTTARNFACGQYLLYEYASQCRPLQAKPVALPKPAPPMPLPREIASESIIITKKTTSQYCQEEMDAYYENWRHLMVENNRAMADFHSVQLPPADLAASEVLLGATNRIRNVAEQVRDLKQQRPACGEDPRLVSQTSIAANLRLPSVVSEGVSRNALKMKADLESLRKDGALQKPSQ